MVTIIRNTGIDTVTISVVTDTGIQVDRFDVLADYETLMAHQSDLMRSRRYVLAIIKAIRLES